LFLLPLTAPARLPDYNPPQTQAKAAHKSILALIYFGTVPVTLTGIIFDYFPLTT
jgi:hypothetical protein